jgi:TRAP-type C4-dicarboxylate transport system substrate-binding protein
MGSLQRLAALLAVLLAAGIAHAEERVLMFATTNAPSTRLNIQFLHPWAEAINQDGKGVIQFDVRDGTAIASVANYYDRVTTGVVQVSWPAQHRRRQVPARRCRDPALHGEKRGRRLASALAALQSRHAGQ